MFCHQCGLELIPRSQFCGRCGQSQSRAQGPKPLASRSEGSPTLVLEPRFLPRLQFLGYLPFSLFLGLWGGGFFGGFSMVLFDLFDLAAPRWVPFVCFGLLFTLAMPIALYRIQRNTYARTRYTFHADRLDYCEGFFAVEEKTISLTQVTEINLRRGALQKAHGLGTVILSTSTGSQAPGKAREGIHIADIDHPDEVHAEIKRLVERAQAGAPERLAA